MGFWETVLTSSSTSDHDLTYIRCGGGVAKEGEVWQGRRRCGKGGGSVTREGEVWQGSGRCGKVGGGVVREGRCDKGGEGVTVIKYS